MILARIFIKSDKQISFWNIHTMIVQSVQTIHLSVSLFPSMFGMNEHKCVKHDVLKIDPKEKSTVVWTTAFCFIWGINDTYIMRSYSKLLYYTYSLYRHFFLFKLMVIILYIFPSEIVVSSFSTVFLNEQQVTVCYAKLLIKLLICWKHL